MRGMRKWKRWAVFLLLFAVLAVGGSWTAQAEMLDMTKYNDELITVSKVPHGKAGNKISIKMTVHNIHEKRDQELKEIWLANAEEFDDLMTENFGESDDADESDDSDAIRWYSKSFPFETDSNSFKPKAINVKSGTSKTVSLSY